ncbi:MAG: hypothetical protein KJO12_09605 [Ignavibacteria bacterium]|nr:hypothetical protein [Ignavibacteria bacterium]
MSNYLISLILLITSTLFAQPERYTKGAENGYAWRELENPLVAFSDAKYNYLSGMLERNGTVNERFPEDEHLGCRNDVNKLLEDGMSDELSLGDMIDAIDGFYNNDENLVIPIVFAYCYCIKEIAEISADELNEYMAEILEFCED